jgi:hypothetical protein
MRTKVKNKMREPVTDDGREKRDERRGSSRRVLTKIRTAVMKAVDPEQD